MVQMITCLKDVDLERMKKRNDAEESISFLFEDKQLERLFGKPRGRTDQRRFPLSQP